MRGALDAAAGHPVEIIADVVGGARSEHVGGPPTSLRLAVGDALILDVIPRHRGYWGDSCSTLLLGEHMGVRDAHARALDALRRGVAAGAGAGVIAGELSTRSCALGSTTRITQVTESAPASSRSRT